MARELHPAALEKRIYNMEMEWPSIEGERLSGNKTFEELGIASGEDLAQTNEDLLEVTQTVNNLEKIKTGVILNSGQGGVTNINISDKNGFVVVFTGRAQTDNFGLYILHTGNQIIKAVYNDSYLTLSYDTDSKILTINSTDVSVQFYKVI